MITAKDFVETARGVGFTYYTGVPCSFLTPFINYVINDSELKYISSANEGDALATAAGAVIGGEKAIVMMQNSGLGNAINPLTSLAHTFHIPILIITTQRGEPGLNDEPQHALMGKITDKLFDTLQVPWEIFPTRVEDIHGVIERTMKHLQTAQTPYGLIMQKNTVVAHSLRPSNMPTLASKRTEIKEFFSAHQAPSRRQALQRIIELTPKQDTILIATTGYTGRELFALADRHNHFYMVGSMGCASSLGLGLASVRPDLKVVVLDGDGAALMRMGNFATLGHYGSANITHILLDNEVHESTGAQATVAKTVHFAEIANACGYALTLAGNCLEMLDELIHATEGPRFGHLKIQPGTMANLPRPSLSPIQVLSRLRQHIGSATYGTVL